MREIQMRQRLKLYPLLVLILTLAFSQLAFAQSERQIAYGVLIDNTGSLETQFPQLKSLAKEIVSRIHKRGPISLFNFVAQGDKGNRLAIVSSGVEWSQDESLLNRHIDNLRIEAGQTTLMDAIEAIATRLDAKAGKDASADKIIILLTDGEDRASNVKEKQLVKELKEREVKVYAIGLVQALAEEAGFIRRSPKETATTFLKRITRETSGRVIFPTSKQSEIDALLIELETK
jgi:hypothetical protein